MAYEGARALSGPFLATLGAGAAAIGWIAGAGELVAFGLRYVSGLITERTGLYWIILFFGYGINLAAVPLLALARQWETAACLLIGERLGKAIRTPARDVLLSDAAAQTGSGWGFALHEAMDQTGALIGPLLAAGLLASSGRYPTAFAWLLAPALAAMIALAAARLLYPKPVALTGSSRRALTKNLPRAFWIHTLGASLIGFGYVDFALGAFHAKHAGLLADAWIPVFYAAAMGADAVSALSLGRWYDRQPRAALLAGVVLGVLAAPLLFLGGAGAWVAGVLAWGAGLGAQESVMRAAVADLTPPARRASAYGAFHALYGLSWFAGSALAGHLYQKSPVALAAISVLAQSAALVLFSRAAPGRKQ